MADQVANREILLGGSRSQRTVLDLVALSTDGQADHPTTLRRLVRCTRDYFGLPFAMISRFEDDQCIIAQRVGQIAPDQTACPASRYCARVMTEGRSVMQARTNNGAREIGCFAGARILVDGRPYGTLSVAGPDARKAGFGEPDRHVLETAAALIGHHLALHRARERYDLAVQGSSAGLWDWDVRTDELFWSPRFMEIIGLEEDRFRPDFTEFSSRLHPDDRERVMLAVSTHLSARKPYDIEYRLRHEDGHYVWIHAKGQAIWSDTGMPVRMAGSVDDISLQHANQEALRCSQERYALAVSGGNVGIWDWNLETGDHYWSPELLAMVERDADGEGPTPQEAMEYIHPDDRERVREALTTHLHDDTPYHVECRILTGGGEYIWLRTRGEAVRDETGRAVRMTGSCININEAKRAEESLREEAGKLALSGAAAHLGYVEFGADGHLLRASKEYRRIFELEDSEFDPDQLHEKTHLDDREAFQATWQSAIETGEVQPLTRRILLSSGEERVVQSWVQCFYDDLGEPARLFGVAQDVTEHREAEMRMRSQAAALQQVNRELGQFAAIASHDLQEPLRKIAAFGEMLERGYADRLDARGHKLLDVMVNSASRMQCLVQDLLTYSKSSHVRLSIGAVDLNAVIDDIESDLEMALEESGARIERVRLPSVQGDETLLHLLLQNLVNNAIKYRGEAPPLIRIAARTEGRGDRRVRHIEVRDNGIGFAPAYAERIFGMFERLHGKGEYSGTGVGLALCNRIVERHGGKIWADSTPGAGSTFHVTLPVEPAG